MSDGIKDSHPIPDAEYNIENLEGLKVVPVDGYGVYEWHPDKDGEGKPTMVFLNMKIGDVQICIRLKSKGELLRLVEMLKRHGDNVWPEQA